MNAERITHGWQYITQQVQEHVVEKEYVIEIKEKSNQLQNIESLEDALR